LLRHQPHIVHFSGHGSGSGATSSSTTGRNVTLVDSSGNTSQINSGAIILEDNNGNSHPVSTKALSNLFALLKDNIRCVVLNACYSEDQAQAIAEHIDVVVGMSTAIGDEAAIVFATAFYQALGYGRSIKTAFDLGVTQLLVMNIPEEKTPRLIANKVDPGQITL
jgi:hypothetical protein